MHTFHSMHTFMHFIEGFYAIFREEFKVRVKFKILSMKYFMGLKKTIFAYSYNGYTFLRFCCELIF